jgi:hypothetical protein
MLKKPGHKLIVLYTKKSMNKFDQLRLMVAQHEIEVERFKNDCCLLFFERRCYIHAREQIHLLL